MLNERSKFSEIVAASDKEVLEARTNFKSKLLPNVWAIMDEAGYMPELAQDLTPAQIDVICDVVADFAAVKRFRKTADEVSRSEKLRGGTVVTVDPLRNRYSQQLHQVAISRFGLVKIADRAAEDVLTAYVQDPSLSDPEFFPSSALVL